MRISLNSAVIVILFIIIQFAAVSQPTVGYVSGIKVVNYDGLKPYLEKDNDTTYIVNFWATWCAPCIKELPHFEKIAQHYSKEYVKVILVSLDFKNQVQSRVIPFIDKNQIKSEVMVLSDPASNIWIDKIEPKWSGSIPATLIYKKDFRVFLEQELSYNQLEEALLSIINRK